MFPCKKRAAGIEQTQIQNNAPSGAEYARIQNNAPSDAARFCKNDIINRYKLFVYFSTYQLSAYLRISYQSSAYLLIVV
jgi:hypothetical protein